MITTELKNQWTAALRSGKYKQGQDMLRTTENEFCCLGVLCDISGIGEWKPQEMLSNMVFSTYGGSSYRMPPDGWLPLTMVDKLTCMNDLQHKTFAEIADWIDENWETDDE